MRTKAPNRPFMGGDNFIVQEIEQELIVFDQDENTVHHLKGEAAEMWRAADSMSRREVLKSVLGLGLATAVFMPRPSQAMSLLPDGAIVPGGCSAGTSTLCVSMICSRVNASMATPGMDICGCDIMLPVCIP